MCIWNLLRVSAPPLITCMNQARGLKSLVPSHSCLMSLASIHCPHLKIHHVLPPSLDCPGLQMEQSLMISHSKNLTCLESPEISSVLTTETSMKPQQAAAHWPNHCYFQPQSLSQTPLEAATNLQFTKHPHFAKLARAASNTAPTRATHCHPVKFIA